MINLKYDINTINYKRDQIKIRFFEESHNIKSDDFKSISERDLYLLYNLYDEVFLNSWFKNNFKGKIKLTLSRQLTRAAGNTRTSKNIAFIKPEDLEFEIKISINHLMNFDKTARDKFVGGVKVNNKLESLMLVFEHELCHVIEFIYYKKSSCNKAIFKNLIYSLFGQTESTHKLVTRNEANFQDYGLLPGNYVIFEYSGEKLEGLITKINKRAVVMSPSNNGKYIDKLGQRYTKYYIPLCNIIKKQINI
jgi:hypothetical protein